ncbi:unnamed protein product [Nippostrongylus brasiliensis]|uniref:BPI2 domain-containing protein n=1 Tax=Nippostrongylus brasiliensis TaxID=27835 RepID=A0A0N4Y7A6_NIPBR|nr:unnamed protein product [Nippostrongylus brasiliensis]
MTAAGEFQASVTSPLLLSVPITGHFEALLGHVALTISVRLESTYGQPQVRSALCQSSIGYVDLNVRNTGVITDFFINAFKAFLISHFKPQVEQRMCNLIETIINTDMNRLLSTMPLKPKSKIGQHGLKNFTLIHFVQNLREKNLLLDYHLTSDPFVQNGAISMLAKGEISWRGNGGTPFFPPNVRIPPPHGVHMVEFYATDYLANSMLYHVYKQHLLDVVVGPESSPQLKASLYFIVIELFVNLQINYLRSCFQDLLLTSCGSGFCIGEFLGALSEQYPDREVEVVFTARKAPLIVFVENRARFRLHGRMNMFVRPRNATQVKEMIIRSDTTMTANVRMWLNSSRIVGNATIENLDFKLLETKIEDVDQASFGDLGLFGAEFLEKLLTEILQLGIVMPSMQGVYLKSPRLVFFFLLPSRFSELLNFSKG